jgi:tetratricopeptide (TPR) repeat protein
MRIFKFFFLVNLCFCFTGLFAQENTSDEVTKLIDSLHLITDRDVQKKVLDRAFAVAQGQHDSLLAQVNYEYGRYYSRFDKEKSISYFQKAYRLNENSGNPRRIGSCLYQIAIAYYRMSNLDSSLYYYEAALDNYILANHKSGIGGCYNGLGLIEEQKGNFETSIEYYYNAIENFTKKNHIALIHNNIGLVSKEMKNYELELESYQKALEIYTETEHLDTEGAAQTFSNLAEYYSRHNQYKLAFENFRKAKRIYEENQNIRGLAIILNNMGTAFLDKNQIDSARVYFSRVIAYCDGKAEMNLNLSYAYRMEGIIMAMSGRCSESIQRIESSLLLLRKMENAFQIKEALFNLVEAHEMCGDYENAFIVQKEYLVVKDSLNSNERAEKFDNLLLKYNTAEKEIELSKSKLAYIKGQETIWKMIALTIILGITAFGLLFLLLRWKKERDYLKNSERKLKADNKNLQKQITLLKDKPEEKEKLLKEHIVLNLLDKSEWRPCLGDIIYIKSDKNYLDIYARNHRKPFVLRSTLKSFKAQLPSAIFCQVHRQYVVNREQIEQIGVKEIRLRENVSIPVSSTFREELEINKSIRPSSA